MGGQVGSGRVLGYEEVDDEEGNGAGEGQGEGARRIAYQRFTDDVEDGVQPAESGGEGRERGSGEVRDGGSDEVARS